MAQRRCPRIPPFNTQEPARCHLPLPDQKLSTPGSSSTGVPLGDFGPKHVGCIYSLDPGCHTFGETRLRLPSIGFPITEKPSEGVSFVALRSGVPRRTTCPPFVATPVVCPRHLLPQTHTVLKDGNWHRLPFRYDALEAQKPSH